MCQGLSFNKVAGLRPATLLKKRLWNRCFPVNFAKFLRTSFLQNTSERLPPLKRRLVGGGISISFSCQWEWVNQFVIREDRNAAISGGKSFCVPVRPKKILLFPKMRAAANFFLSILRRYSIFFFSFFRFFYIVVFCLFVWFLKIKIYILIHIRLCGQVSDKKNFTRSISGNKTLCFWPNKYFYHMIIIATLLLSLTGKYSFILKYRSSYWRCSVRKVALRCFVKFTGIHLYRSLFLNKVAGFNNTFFYKTPPVAASENLCRLLAEKHFSRFSKSK